jgi:hypothetical protein
LALKAEAAIARTNEAAIMDLRTKVFIKLYFVIEVRDLNDFVGLII